MIAFLARILGLLWAVVEIVPRFFGLACALFVAGCLMPGCSSQDKTAQTLAFLQEGKARGHLNVTSNGKVGGGIATNVYGGADSASIAFDGDVDFGDSVRHVSGLPVTTEP